MESEISVSGKGKNAGSNEKPFSGLLQSKQGEKQSGQGIEKQGTTDRVKPEKPSAKNRVQGKLGQATAVRNAVPHANDNMMWSMLEMAVLRCVFGVPSCAGWSVPCSKHV